MYVVLMLFFLSVSSICFSQTEEQTLLQSLLGGAGQSLMTMSAANQAAAMKRIEGAIEETDERLAEMGIKPGSKCGTLCKKQCFGSQTYCQTKGSSLCPCNAGADKCSMTVTNEACLGQVSVCNTPPLCSSFKACEKECKARKTLVRSKYLSWDSLLALAGVTAATISQANLKDKRSCEDKCGSLSGKEKEACLQGNTNEYGESCAYTVQAGQCDDTDPIVKEGVCASWTGGCELYKQQCSCNLRAEQTKQAYTWDPDKSTCVLHEDKTKMDSTIGGTDDGLLAGDTAAEEEAAKTDAKTTASGSGGGGITGSSSTKGGAGALAAKNAKDKAAPKGTTLSQKEGAAFSPQTYTGYVGESGGVQGDTSGNKKAEDIAASDTKETLLEMIHKTYTDFTTAGRFLSADFKVQEKKIPVKKTKRLKKKA